MRMAPRSGAWSRNSEGRPAGAPGCSAAHPICVRSSRKTAAKRMAGTILNADPQQSGPLIGVRIKRRAGDTTVPVQTVMQQMNVSVEVNEGAVLILEHIGYRTLHLDLTRLAAVARRRAAAGAVALQE